jgi:hypothetical protein
MAWGAEKPSIKRMRKEQFRIAFIVASLCWAGGLKKLSITTIAVRGQIARLPQGDARISLDTPEAPVKIMTVSIIFQTRR